MIAWALRDYCRLAGTRTTDIEPGSPWENPFVESFNNRVRDELFNVEEFATLLEAQAMVAVRVRPPTRTNIEDFKAWAAELPETLSVFVTTGNEDFLIHVAVTDNDHLYAFVIDRLTERPEVADVRTSVVYENITSKNAVPTWTTHQDSDDG